MADEVSPELQWTKSAAAAALGVLWPCMPEHRQRSAPLIVDISCGLGATAVAAGERWLSSMPQAPQSAVQEERLLSHPPPPSEGGQQHQEQQEQWRYQQLCSAASSSARPPPQPHVILVDDVSESMVAASRAVQLWARALHPCS
mmetsp:Transcript_41755/g.105727  ORF Transcript_41755/g.105727 Transcript_41755/m.105727 type:complete len:144 (+) Transcript_41755:494-925(+)